MRPIAALILGATALGGAFAASQARRRQREAVIARRQLAVLTDAVGSLARATAPEDFLVGVLRAIAEQLEAGWVLLFLHDPARDTLAVHLALKDGQLVPRERTMLNHGSPVPARSIPIWGELEHLRRPIHVADVRSYPGLRQREALIAQGVRAMLVVPLFLGEGLIGWFSIRDREPRQYRQDQLDLAAALAQQAALAVQLGRLGEQGRQAAVLEERNRIAREIHDTLAQGFTGILMQLEATESALETGRPGLATERLERARALARSSLAEARRSVWALRPEALEGRGFVAALRTAAARLTVDAGLELHVESAGALPTLPPDLEVDLLRVAQEAISNAVRHAAARTLVVRVDVTDGQLALQVCDDGRGFAPPDGRSTDGSGFGLTAMRERAERHGGDLRLQSAPGAGTTLSVRIPLPADTRFT